VEGSGFTRRSARTGVLVAEGRAACQSKPSWKTPSSAECEWAPPPPAPGPDVRDRGDSRRGPIDR